MKKHFLVFALCLLVTPLFAQDNLSTKPLATKPYKLALGVRYLPGGPAPDITFNAKYFFRPQSAIEVQAGKLSRNQATMATISYIWQPELLTSAKLRPYAGIGVGAIRYHDFQPESSIIKTNPVAVLNAGLEYRLSKAPLAFSLDYRAPIVRFDTSPTQARTPLSDFSNLGVGIKFLLK
jgi:outer membrane protein W